MTLDASTRGRPTGERCDRLLAALGFEPTYLRRPVQMADELREVLRGRDRRRAACRSSSCRRVPGTMRACSPAAGVPSAMLFVRSLNGGISHSPDELSSEEDVELAVDVLASALARL